MIFLAAAPARAITVSFEFDDDGNAIEHGQIIDDVSDVGPNVTHTEFFTRFSISSLLGNGQGIAAFDSNLPPGTLDDDLLAGLGNILYLQNDDSPAIGGALSGRGNSFVSPNDERNFPIGSIIFDFVMPYEMLSIDIVDADRLFGADVIMTDLGGTTRTYAVPANWSNEPPAPVGFETLDLQSQTAQPGEGGATVPVPTDIGDFDVTKVIEMEIEFRGSGAIDNLNFRRDVFVPEPSTLSLLWLGMSSLFGLRLVYRRRRSQPSS